MSIFSYFWVNLRIFVAKITIAFVFAEIKLLGLVAYHLNYVDRVATLSAWKVLYSGTVGLLLGMAYIWIAISLLGDRNLEYFYAGVSFYVIVITSVLSIVLIFTFYAFQIINRRNMANYHNILRENYTNFGLFYGNRIKFDSSDRKYAENIREIDFVYMPLFGKCVIHLTIVLTHILISLFIDIIFPGESFVGILVHLLAPYALQSCTSTYLFLATKKMAFLYMEMSRKLMEMRVGVIRLVVEDSQASQFERMTAFCDLSDQVDSMAISFRKITQMGMKLAEYYGLHMLFILAYSVSTSLMMLFFQYMGLAHHSRGLFTYDIRVAAATTGFIILNVVEILLIINVVEDAELRCRRVMKEIHLINYWQRKFDVRLKQSVSLWWNTSPGTV